MFEGGTDQVLCGTLCIALQEIGVYDIGDLLVLKELPDAVTRQYYDLIGGVHVELRDFGDGVHTDLTGDLITEGTAHSQARDILVLKPNTLRANLLSLAVAVGIDAAARRQNDLCLDRIIRLVVPGQLPSNAP